MYWALLYNSVYSNCVNASVLVFLTIALITWSIVDRVALADWLSSSNRFKDKASLSRQEKISPETSVLSAF